MIKKILNHTKTLKAYFVRKENKTLDLNYEQYLKLQLAKTSDPQRISKWKNEEWIIKLNGFENMFQRLSDFVGDKNNAILLGARTGQEVAALRNIGKKAIGVDLVEFPPYTIIGDVHNLPFENETFDLAFTNIFDHVLMPAKMLSEVYRVLVNNGVFILQIQLGFDPDEYSVNYVNNLDELKQLIKSLNFNIISGKTIANKHDLMNYELILTK